LQTRLGNALQGHPEIALPIKRFFGINSERVIAERRQGLAGVFSFLFFFLFFSNVFESVVEALSESWGWGFGLSCRGCLVFVVSQCLGVVVC
jgi:hypothetical protein